LTDRSASRNPVAVGSGFQLDESHAWLKAYRAYQPVVSRAVEIMRTRGQHEAADHLEENARGLGFFVYEYTEAVIAREIVEAVLDAARELAVSGEPSNSRYAWQSLVDMIEDWLSDTPRNHVGELWE
jgi:hypothetical protein